MKKINFQRKNSDAAKGKENDSVVDSVYKKLKTKIHRFVNHGKPLIIC